MNEVKIVIEGLNELTEAVRALARPVGVQGAGMPGTPVAPPAPVQQPYAPAAQAGPAVAPVSQGYAPVPVQQAPTGNTVPVTATVQGYTLEQLQVAAAGLTGAGKMPQVMGVLQQFGIQAMTELPKERYGEFAAALRGAGAQI